MYRYLALVWNRLDSAKAERASSLARSLEKDGWRTVLNAPGTRVLDIDAAHGSSCCLQLVHQAGVVLGTLFVGAKTDQAASVRARVIDDSESARIVDTRGQHLVDRYWGRYVAVLYDDERGATSVLRDPSGALPCLRAVHHGIDVFFSDVESALALGVSGLSINWKYIAGVVCSRGLQVKETGLNEVREVQPGEQIDLRMGRESSSVLWNPLRISQQDRIENTREATTAVYKVTRDCIHAWAACHESILHRLSGGLDSSIVASCLSDAPSQPDVVCLNYFGLGAHEDERSFARSVAASTGFRLIEQYHNPQITLLDTVLDVARTERPRYLIYHVEHSEFEAHLADVAGASAMFGGAGGDGLFYQNTAILAATDYLSTYGASPGLWRTALHAARMDRLSIWAVLRHAISEVMLNKQWNPMDEMGTGRVFVRPEVIHFVKTDGSLAHPWMDESAGVPHGKLWHAMGVSTPLPFYDPLGRQEDPESIYPLLSQPLLELCMRIPVYALIDGGWDRAIARKAFANSLPSEIVRRRAKGGSTRSNKLLFERNLPFIRELMLDGLLVRAGLLDRKKLEMHLRPGKPPHTIAFGEILIEHLCTEAWLRTWDAGNTAASSVA